TFHGSRFIDAFTRAACAVLPIQHGHILSITEFSALTATLQQRAFCGYVRWEDLLFPVSPMERGSSLLKRSQQNQKSPTALGIDPNPRLFIISGLSLRTLNPVISATIASGFCSPSDKVTYRLRVTLLFVCHVGSRLIQD